MLKSKDLPIRNGILNHLKKHQAKIDALPSYKAQVLQSKRAWQSKKKSKAQKSAFNSVEKELQKIAPGKIRHCQYCESNIGTNIEHVYPKGWFPNLTFNWTNFLWACQQCNGIYKIAQFQLFEAPDSSKTINLRANKKFKAPPNEDAVFINPRVDNPMDYLILNLESGLFQIIANDPRSRAYKRAQYTLATLRLNRRQHLASERQQAYHTYTQLLVEYITARFESLDLPLANKRCLQLQKTILSMPHPTVWKEMQRQSNQIASLSAYFALAPEALAWDY